jgi:hypothetical protein
MITGTSDDEQRTLAAYNLLCADTNRALEKYGNRAGMNAIFLILMEMLHKSYGDRYREILAEQAANWDASLKKAKEMMQ